MTKNERLELNQLSKVVYGISSKWQKMVEKGERGPQIEKMKDGTERTYQGIVRYSVEEIKKIMQELEAEELDNKAKEELENEAKAQREKIKEMAGETEEKTQEIKQEDTIKTILETIEG